MSFVIDILLLGIILFALIAGWRKGFIRSIMNLISFFVALIGANYLYSAFGNYLNRIFFMDKISDFIEQTIISNSAKLTIDQLFTEKPSFFTEILNKFSNASDVEKYYNTQLEAGATDLTRKVSEYMAAPIASTVSKVIAFIGLFIAFIIVLKIITIILDKLFKLPMLNTINKVFGLIFGGVFGLLLTWVLSVVLINLLPKLAILIPNVFNENTADNTILLQVLYKFSPFSLFEYLNFK